MYGEGWETGERKRFRCLTSHVAQLSSIESVLEAIAGDMVKWWGGGLPTLRLAFCATRDSTQRNSSPLFSLFASFPRFKRSHIDLRTGGPAAISSARFKGLGEEAAAVKRRLRDKCRRWWAATRTCPGGSANGGSNGAGGSSNGSSGRGIGWTGVTAEERAEYAAVAESVLGGFVDGRGRGEDVGYARRRDVLVWMHV